MADLFQDKAEGWDTRPIPAQISEGVSQAILTHTPLNADMTIMDFGAGTGLVCSKVAPTVKRVIAVDISEAMLAQLAEKSKQQPELEGKVEVVCQDITHTPLNQEVELIVSAMAMHHVEDTQALFHTFAAHLSQGGRLALADLDKEDGDFHPPGVEGVFHAGFKRSSLQTIAEAAGFSEVSFVTAAEVNKEGKPYPIFLMSAVKA